jgi:hypothetical protein
MIVLLLWFVALVGVPALAHVCKWGLLGTYYFFRYFLIGRLGFNVGYGWWCEDVDLTLLEVFVFLCIFDGDVGGGGGILLIFDDGLHGLELLFDLGEMLCGDLIDMTLLIIGGIVMKDLIRSK